MQVHNRSHHHRGQRRRHHSQGVREPDLPGASSEAATSRDDAKWKAEQEKQRKEQAIANTTGLRVLTAIGSAVPVRLMKRDLLFILEKLAAHG